ncbi:gibberellin 3-beta-dioxygenase 1 isoform X6 [Physcomitrium patens]|uniref:gibberellin 3-beta-dioxygenase 1 isoform X6 n=1 Tax=Physcomitrium patens TaxID=3218 RepID=UPI003CCDC0A1
MELVLEGLKPQVNSAHFQPYLTEQFGVLRISNYPASEHPDRDIGLPPHIDDTLLTIVHQGCDVKGLELIKDGQWVLTNATYKAVLHRAVPNQGKGRLSMMYSAYPPANILITTAPENVSSAHPPLCKPFTWTEYLSGQVSDIFNPLIAFQLEERRSFESMFRIIRKLQRTSSGPRDAE